MSRPERGERIVEVVTATTVAVDKGPHALSLSVPDRIDKPLTLPTSTQVRLSIHKRASIVPGGEGHLGVHFTDTRAVSRMLQEVLINLADLRQ